MVQCPEPVVAECISPEGTPVLLVASVHDDDGDTLVVEWSVDGAVLHTEEVVAGEDGVTSAEVEFDGLFGAGEHLVVVSVSDGTAEAATCSTTVTVQDTVPPVVTSVIPSQRILWPPNHKMIPVAISVLAEDDCGPVMSRIIDVASDEPINGKGDGNTAPDWRVTGDLTLELRAERAGGGDGRVYTITVETLDHAEHRVVSITEVHVPHDMGHDVYLPEEPAKVLKGKVIVGGDPRSKALQLRR
jgi:hypothetical protein